MCKVSLKLKISKNINGRNFLDVNSKQVSTDFILPCFELSSCNFILQHNNALQVCHVKVTLHMLHLNIKISQFSKHCPDLNITAEGMYCLCIFLCFLTIIFIQICNCVILFIKYSFYTSDILHLSMKK